MAGIYIHIPFCKQACHYCNFHFATSLRRKNELIDALLGEIDLNSPLTPAGHEEQAILNKNDLVETIYFGGGTPSLLKAEELIALLDKIRSGFTVSERAEITLEANPDDIDEAIIRAWKAAGINRLSIGIQSFFEEDLQWMNRAHDAGQAIDCLEKSLPFFDNISVDLIYGTPTLSDENWKKNVEIVTSYRVPHLSCYALTVEPKTPLQKMIQQQLKENTDPDKQANQFLALMEWLGEEGYEHYEISNFAKPGFRSLHNSSYWEGKKYLGLGPSAHSFNGRLRRWNVPNNNLYINSIQRGIIPAEHEILTSSQKLNEYLMTSIRTIEGIDLAKVEKGWGKDATNAIGKDAEKFIEAGKALLQANKIQLTNEGKLLADGIASALFVE